MTNTMERGHKASAKGIDSDQPAQCTQADLGRTFLLWVIFLQLIGPVGQNSGICYRINPFSNEKF